MKTSTFFLLISSAAQILLTGSALPVPTLSPQMAELDSNSTWCAQIHGNSTTQLFAATPNDVQAFKFYCTNYLITSQIDEDSVEVIKCCTEFLTISHINPTGGYCILTTASSIF